MTDGLITRIGKWIDRKWQAKATELDVDNLATEMRHRWNAIENAQIKDTIELRDGIKAVDGALAQLAFKVNALPPEGVTQALSKDIADFKKRLEQLELYVGMKRVVDPTKAPVAKSAFSM